MALIPEPSPLRGAGHAAEVLGAGCAARESDRSAAGGRVIWKLTTQGARVELRHLYPQTIFEQTDHDEGQLLRAIR